MLNPPKKLKQKTSKTTSHMDHLHCQLSLRATIQSLFKSKQSPKASQVVKLKCQVWSVQKKCRDKNKEPDYEAIRRVGLAGCRPLYNHVGPRAFSQLIFPWFLSSSPPSQNALEKRVRGQGQWTFSSNFDWKEAEQRWYKESRKDQLRNGLEPI